MADSIRKSPGWHRGGNATLNRRHKNTTVAALFGITENARSYIEGTVYNRLDRDGLGIANTGICQWDSSQLTVRESRAGDGRIIQIEVIYALESTHPDPERLARAIGAALLDKFVDAASGYATSLTRTIIEHRRVRAVDWKAVVNQAIEFCSHLADWDRSHRWFVGPFKAGGFDDKDIPSSAKVAFLNSLSLWSSGYWQASYWTPEKGFIFTQSLANPSVSLRGVLLEQIMQIVRLSPMDVVPDLSERERKIWDVIQQGATSLQYCRELDNAGIAPLRGGVWKDCPSRKYESAYMEGPPWPHRIQDEKSKIRRKAQLAGLASE